MTRCGIFLSPPPPEFQLKSLRVTLSGIGKQDEVEAMAEALDH